MVAEVADLQGDYSSDEEDELLVEDDLYHDEDLEDEEDSEEEELTGNHSQRRLEWDHNI